MRYLDFVDKAHHSQLLSHHSNATCLERCCSTTVFAHEWRGLNRNLNDNERPNTKNGETLSQRVR